MGQSDYDRALRELIEQGIVPDPEVVKPKPSDVTDEELQLILNMEKIAGVKYSDEQKKILLNKDNSCIIACAGSGKALVNGTGVLTPNGYVPIEELKIYDKVYGESGTTEFVLGVFPQGKKQVCKVTFNDGHVIKCCKDHLWTVKDRITVDNDTHSIEKVVDTATLVKHFKNGGSAVLIPSFKAIEFSKHDRYKGVFKLTPEQAYKKLLNETKLKYYSDLNEYYYSKKDNIFRLFELIRIVANEYTYVFDKTLAEDIKTYIELEGGHCTLDYDNNLHRYAIFYIGKGSAIVNVEETDEFAEMTCIKVSGKSELFVTEHFYITHNTTVLTNLIAKRILNGEIKNTNKLVCTTYSKGGATEMEDRLHALLQKFGMDRPIKVATMHAFFLSILRTFGVQMSILDESQRMKMIKESAKEAELELRDEDLADLSNLISFQINNLMSDKKALMSEANTLESLTLEKYAKIRKGFALKKAAEGKIDFDDMQVYLYKWIVKDKTSENELERQSAERVRNYCQAMWDDFYIDEAQDISKIQFAIIREMIQHPTEKGKLIKKLTFCGDDDQCIYKWRGADPSIILNIGNQFNMKLLMLSTNYRCAENIVNFAADSVKNNSARYDKSMKAFNKGGNVKIALCDKKDLCHLSTIALKHIKKLVDNGENPNDICVMSRNNFHLAILNNMLLNEGIYTTSTADMKLTNSSMYKDVKMILDSLRDPYDYTITRSLLWKLCRYMSANNANNIAKFQQEAGITLRETLAYLFRYFEYDSSISVKKDKDGNEKDLIIHKQVLESTKYRWRTIHGETKTYLRQLLTILDEQDINKKIAGMLTMYVDCVGGLLYKREDKQRSLKGLCNYISVLLDRMGYENTMEFLRITEQYENGVMAVPGPKVTLTTIHSAKGKEWKNVIAFAVDNVTMPSKDDIKSMIQDGNSIHEVNEYIDEERRLYYVEMTRAKENLLIITYSHNPSVFLLESLDAINDPGNIGTNALLIDTLSSDSYVSYQQTKNLFNMEKFLSLTQAEDGKYYYEQ